MTEAIRCVVCGDTNFRPLFPAMANGFSVSGCATCGARRTMPDLSEQEVAGYYPQTYYGDSKRFAWGLERAVGAVRKKRARDVAALLGAPGPIMDVGCGRGVMLGDLQKLGYKAFGIELSDSAAAHARSLGIDVGTDLFADRYEKGSFVGVTFYHSLEHIRRADLAIARAVELLKPGGVIGIAVPNSGSLQATLFSRYWFHLDVPRHYHHFTAENVERMLQNAGLGVFQRSTLSLEQNPYGYVQSALNAVGVPENLLYSLLKDPSARMHAISEHPIAAAASALAAPTLATVGVLASGAEALVGRGGIIELWARKP